MNKTTEALKMTIEKSITEFEILSSFPQYDLDYVDMIKELRGCLEALESQEQEPMTTTDVITCLMSGKCCMTGETIYTHPAPSQEQEPVAWMYQREDGAGTLNFDRNFALIDKGYREIPLYKGVKDE